MPIIGWMIGEYISLVVGSYAKLLAAIILFVIGGRLIWEQFSSDKNHWQGDPTRGVSLLILMFATSVDALAAGFTLGLVGTQILYPAIVIGVVASSMTILGLIFGQKLGIKFSLSAGVIGGLILIGLGVKAWLG